MCPRQHPHAKFSFDNDSTRIFSLVQKRPDSLHEECQMRD